MDELISGGISGAITDPDCERAKEHAKRFYEAMRHTNSDVIRIAENTGLSREQVLMIKNYLFVDEHWLRDGLARFDPSFEIAQSWQRLAGKRENILPHDLTLLKHEIR